MLTDAPAPRQRLVIEGARIVDIPAFYAEVNRVFMAGETWQLADSLDALNDMLYGGYGAIDGKAPVLVVWQDMDRSRAALGPDATRAFLQARLPARTMFNNAPIADQIAALDRGEGTTYFDIVMDIFRDHPNIEIAPA